MTCLPTDFSAATPFRFGWAGETEDPIAAEANDVVRADSGALCLVSLGCCSSEVVLRAVDVGSTGLRVEASVLGYLPAVEGAEAEYLSRWCTSDACAAGADDLSTPSRWDAIE